MAKFEVFKDVRGEYRWRLRSANGQIFAIGGEGFKQKSGAENGIAAVKRDAVAAEIIDLSDSPLTTSISSKMEPGMAKKKLPPPM
ncbi:MAG: DUF1508 domain-containing protein [Hamadaea sp.]|uniref:YegP family protein n=1 Tax=Hamadaea sp. TaxID=2024425 RepID=UPI00182208D9|nr:DUF1508 domain-containing protein [Hamadaea sp.]NUR69957.1 DUF1508 domain-containing protein [Hamadaea sp.]NUT20661.1 DUF1508 domain-containing protein [Hamadaea sp.]